MSKIDSLLSLLKTDYADTNKVAHLNKLCIEYSLTGESDKCLNYGKQAIELSQNLGYKRGLGDSYSLIGKTYTYLGNYPEALKMLVNGLKIQEETKNKKAIANTYISLGTLYYYQGNYQEALKHYLFSLKISQEIGDIISIASAYDGIGIVSSVQGKDSEALKYYFEALKIKKKIGNGKDVRLSLSYMNIGEIYAKQNNYEEALKYNFIALKINEENKNTGGTAVSYLSIGEMYSKLKQSKKAEYYLKKGLEFNIKLGNKYWIQKCYESLVVLDSMQRNYRSAFNNHKMYIIYRDSLNNEEAQKKVLQTAMQYEFDKKEAVAKAEHKVEMEKQNEIAEERGKRQKTIIWSMLVGLLLVLLFAGLILRSLQIARKQKHIIEEKSKEVEEKNKDILDSIRYAKRIQTSLLPTEKYIERIMTKK